MYYDFVCFQSSYPRRLPFSEFVPKVYHQIKEFIYACHKFSQDLHLAQTERDDMIRKSTNILLTRTLSGCLSELIKRESLGLTEVIFHCYVGTQHFIWFASISFVIVIEDTQFCYKVNSSKREVLLECWGAKNCHCQNLKSCVQRFSV